MIIPSKSMPSKARMGFLFGLRADFFRFLPADGFLARDVLGAGGRDERACLGIGGGVGMQSV